VNDIAADFAVSMLVLIACCVLLGAWGLVPWALVWLVLRCR